MDTVVEPDTSCTVQPLGRESFSVTSRLSGDLPLGLGVPRDGGSQNLDPYFSKPTPKLVDDPFGSTRLFCRCPSSCPSWTHLRSPSKVCDPAPTRPRPSVGRRVTAPRNERPIASHRALPRRVINPTTRPRRTPSPPFVYYLWSGRGFRPVSTPDGVPRDLLRPLGSWRGSSGVRTPGVFSG